MDLCRWITAHSELLSVILFTDEASFTRDGINNSRNVPTWSHENPHETRVTYFQTAQQLEEDTLNNYCKAGTVF